MSSLLERVRHAFRVWQSRRREKAKARSPHWAALRDDVIRRQKLCEACCGTRELQVHHVVPVSVDPRLELVRSNLMVLCMGRLECHLRIGHGDDWSSWNPLVREQVSMFEPKHPQRTWAAARSMRMR